MSVASLRVGRAGEAGRVSLGEAPAASSGVRGIVGTVILGEVMVQLGLAPITVALPGLSAAMGVDAPTGSWILTVFILALAGSLLVAGRLGDLLGHRVMFGGGAALYAIGSLGAGLAGGFEMLLVGRAIQGVGAAMISGNNLAILTRTVSPKERGRAMGVLAFCASIAALVGSGIGALVVNVGEWRWLFLAMIPLALVACARSRGLPSPESSIEATRVDWAGAATLVVAITALALALNHPHGTASEAVMPVFHQLLPAVALVAGALFVAIERRARPPLMDWARLRTLPFAAAVGVNWILHMAMMAAMFLGPILIERGFALGGLASATLYLTVMGSMIVTTMLGGWLHDRTRWRGLRPTAAFVIAGGLVLWAVAALLESYVALLAVAVVTGLGNGILLAVNNTVLMGTLPARYRGAASGMLETTRHFGHALGVTIPTAILALAATATPDFGDAVRYGFAWSSGLMGLVALGAAALALVPSGEAR
jgi:MFS family permease